MATPEEIFSGGTKYVLAPASGGHTWFTAEGHEGDPAFTWMYVVDHNRNNTIYFANRGTKEVVWTLPDLNPPAAQTAAAAAPVMRVKPRGSSTGTRTPVETPSEPPAANAAPLTGGTSATTPAAAVTPSASRLAPPPQPAAAKSPSPTRLEQARQAIRDRLRARLGGNSAFSALEPPVAPPKPSTHPTLSVTAPSSKPAATSPPSAPSPSKDDDRLSADGGAAGGLSARERVAQLRARRSTTPHTSQPSTPRDSPLQRPKSPSSQLVAEASPQKAPSAVVVSPTKSDPPAAAAEKPHAAAAATGTAEQQQKPPPVVVPQAPQVPPDATTRPPPSKPASPPAAAVQLESSSTPTVRTPTPSKDFEQKLQMERRREALEADVQLQREREEAAHRERIAMERARRIQEELVRHEEMLLRAVEERRRMEERRMEFERRRMQEISTRVSLLDSGSSITTVQQQYYSPAKIGIDEPLLGSTTSPLTFEDRVREQLAAGRGTSSRLQSQILRELDDAVDGAGADADADDTNISIGDQMQPTNASLKYDSNLSYSGSVVRGGVRHGRGRLLYDPQGRSLYDGEWKNDKKHGNGVMSLPHMLYDGSFADDAPHGSGLLQSTNMKAAVTFRRGVLSGSAVVQVRSGETFTGLLHGGKLSTPGSLLLPNQQDKIEWQWADPNSTGTGSAIVTFANGDQYSGDVAQYRLHGKGYLAMRVNDPSTRSEYTGEFVNGAMEGHGLYRFANGSVYEGAFRGNLFHGFGTYSAAAIQTAPMVAEQDDAGRAVSLSPLTNVGSPAPPVAAAAVAQAPLIAPSTAVPFSYTYEGEWHQGRMHGAGAIRYANGDVWKGTFVRDKRAVGKYIFSSEFQLA